MPVPPARKVTIPAQGDARICILASAGDVETGCSRWNPAHLT
ncbi:hypothetical protein DM2_2451 [Halorubrum sp. DM2]|nr:hypothetical protein DM2_2451 [Halorubrum sp. DM2]